MHDEGSGVVVKAILMGMPWMVPAGWRNRLPEVPWRALEALPEGRLGHGMNKFTLLGDAAGGLGGGPAGRWGSEDGRQRQVVGVHHASGERRHLFGAGEGPTEAVAAAKQESIGAKRKEFVKKFVSEQWILSCKSLGRPLVYHL